ncbi:hypothetical protein N7495_006322 [Penicillium taxi]|uniref:uncharacterized protein n=1 Tax=Penicillium taxi TaxID=168475 RepID=UPI0025455B5E|nr:uncharacterized protein N7495_006322 [Penicillium taxi]KAJ5894631.1 hypothetical protein N7495_006322 [Penicillium taxi]
MPNRRAEVLSSDSIYSHASYKARDADVSRKYLAEDLEQMSEFEALNRSLSVQTTITTTSSFSRRHQYARNNPRFQTINQIGAGLQGVIFEQVGFPTALKLESPGNATKKSNLRHEYKLHCAVSAAFEIYSPILQITIRVPRPLEFIAAENDVFWSSIFSKLPQPYRQRGDIVKMERVLPLTKVVRRALITRFSPKSSTEKIEELLNCPENKHCFVRPYMGKQNGPGQFSLRNFPLYLQSMEDLHMDLDELATSMGKAYAIMHWGAGVTGDDVEFVIGTSTQESVQQFLPSSLSALSDFHNRVTSIYLLDFGQCDEVNFTDEPEAVYQAFKAAMILGDNQLFIPHYLRTPGLFRKFKSGYSQAGKIILEERNLESRFSIEDFMQEYKEYCEDLL